MKTSTVLFKVLFPGLLAFLTSLKDSIMQELDILKAKLVELTTTNQGLVSKVEESNGKTDALIAAAGVTATSLASTAAALTALQAQVAAGGGVQAADIQPLIDQVQAILDASAASLTSITAQEVQTDAATAALNPAPQTPAA